MMPPRGEMSLATPPKLPSLNLLPVWRRQAPPASVGYPATLPGWTSLTLKQRLRHPCHKSRLLLPLRAFWLWHVHDAKVSPRRQTFSRLYTFGVGCALLYTG